MIAEAAYLAQLGVWLCRERRALRLTQTELGAAVGISAASISSWESGRSEMGVVSHARLRAFFNARRTNRESGREGEQ